MQICLFDKLPGNGYIDDLSKYIDGGIQFSTSIPGLYSKLDMNISTDIVKSFNIFQNYLGNRVVIFDDFGSVAWDGLIWSVELEMGGVSLGPRDLGFVSNYVAVEYSDMLNDGRYGLTAYGTDSDSQNLYGIKEEVPSYGSITAVAAANAASRYLANHANPFLTGSLSIPLSGDNISVRVGAVGYWATANYRKFQSTIVTTTSVQTRITEIVNGSVTPAAPGGSTYLQYFSTDTSLIEGTNLTIARASLQTYTVGSYLAKVVSLGDTSFNTWYIGAEAGAYNGAFPVGLPRIKVWQRPTTPEYFVDIAGGTITNVSGAEVSPFAIRAGNFVQFRDLIPSASQLSQPLDQLRGFIVAETTYDSRSGLLTAKPEGADQDVDIILARMGR